MTVDEPVLTRLERAERSARERRLAAESDAERELERASLAVARIQSEAPAHAAAAVTALRDEHLRRARDQVAALETELAALEEHASAGPEEGLRFDRAVEYVVAAVLGEI